MNENTRFNVRKTLNPKITRAWNKIINVNDLIGNI